MTLPFSRSKLPEQLFINNEYVDSKNSRKLTLLNPADESTVSENTPCAGEEDVEAAVAAAEKALPGWKKTPNKARQAVLLKFADLIEKHIEVLSELNRITLGVPFEGAGAFEAAMCVDAIRYYAGWVDKIGGESWPAEDGFAKIVRYEPYGVTAGITPWNGPLVMAGFKTGPALAAGNCIILKPSEKTPYATLALGALAKEAGIPAGVFQVLSGDGSTGALLASHMRIRKVSFTGSIPTGKKIQEMAAKSNLKRVTLELGGKSPAVIFDDCNLENAVTWAVNAITMNSGQVCIASSRVYVQEGIYDKFVEQYTQQMKQRRDLVGDPEKKGTAFGPLVDKLQFDRVTGFIERGQQGQGKIVVGGKRIGDKGYFIEPTVFVDVDPESEIHNQEIFGPVAVVRKFKTEEEVIKWSIDTEYGLMSNVFTQDINRALRVAGEFESGLVGVNCAIALSTGQPFGGYKQSGQGRECGKEGILSWLQQKTLIINMTY